MTHARTHHTRRDILTVIFAGSFASIQLPVVAQATPEAPLPIVAVSTPLIADIVRQVAGDAVEVRSVMPEDADPHIWEASAQDIAAIGEVDLFISVGAHLEPFIESGGWRRAVDDAEIPQLVLADHVDLIVVDKVIDHGDHVHDLTGGDPHFWLDPLRVVQAVPAIVDSLVSLAPGSEPVFTANGDAFIARLEALDRELTKSFAAIPAERRVLVVFHDAYTYFAARYGFEVVGVVVRNPEVELSAQEVVELQGIIEDHGISVIFAEPQFNTSVLDLFVAENDIQVGELLTDAFAGRVTSYEELMRYNRDSLVGALGA